MTVEERAVPKSDIPGEDASPSQPIPAWSPMVPQKLTAADAWGPTPEMRQWCADKIKSLRNDGLFTPPSFAGIDFVSRQCRRRQLGRRCVGPGAQSAAREHQSRGGRDAIDSARGYAGGAASIPTTWLGAASSRRQRGTPYAMHRDWLVSPSGLPCNAPPWGALVAFDLNTGKLRWESADGSMAPGAPAGSPEPRRTDGHRGRTDLHGGRDGSRTCARSTPTPAKEMWTAELPASAQSTPMTYEWNGQTVHRHLRRRPRQVEEQDGRFGGRVRAAIRTICRLTLGSRNATP